MNDPVILERPGARLIGEATGSGADVLLLHAGGETRAVWRPVMAKLAETRLRSTAFDQRGHGESGVRPEDGISAFGEDTVAMIAGLKRPVVVGASLGGFALMLALSQVEADAAGLVLVDVTPAPDVSRTRAYLAPRGALGASPLVDDILSRSDQLSRNLRAMTLPILLVCGGARSPLDEDARTRFTTLAPHAAIRMISRPAISSRATRRMSLQQ